MNHEIILVSNNWQLRTGCKDYILKHLWGRNEKLMQMMQILKWLFYTWCCLDAIKSKPDLYHFIWPINIPLRLNSFSNVAVWHRWSSQINASQPNTKCSSQGETDERIAPRLDRILLNLRPAKTCSFPPTERPLLSSFLYILLTHFCFIYLRHLIAVINEMSTTGNKVMGSSREGKRPSFQPATSFPSHSVVSVWS